MRPSVPKELTLPPEITFNYILLLCSTLPPPPLTVQSSYPFTELPRTVFDIKKPLRAENSDMFNITSTERYFIPRQIV
jgi:hypothetical protein